MECITRSQLGSVGEQLGRHADMVDEHHAVSARERGEVEQHWGCGLSLVAMGFGDVAAG